MLSRLYIHNYRCFENFEVDFQDLPSALLIGKSGTGKSSVGAILEVFQKIARGQNRVKELVRPGDLAWHRVDVPIVLEIECLLRGRSIRYRVAFEFPENFHELRVAEELLVVDGEERLSRHRAQVTKPSQFTVDWHLVALPILRSQNTADPARAFQDWLAQMVVLEPIPQFIDGDSSEGTLLPVRDAGNLADWFSGLQGRWPHTYSDIAEFLKPLLTDLKFIENRPYGRGTNSLFCHFETESGTSLELPLERLSAGEKCYFIGAIATAAMKASGPLLLYWDEVDNHLTLAEVGHFVMTLRREARQGNQLIVTSHSPETIRKFSGENTLYLSRSGHKEPTRVRPLSEVKYDGTLVEALIRDDLTL